MEIRAFYTLVLCCFLAFASSAFGRVLTDLEGEKITLPDQPQHIACLYQPAYDKILMLSAGKRIALMPREASPWALRFYPEIGIIPKMPAAGEVPDPERLLAGGIDLLIYPKGHYDVRTILQAGIATICPFNSVLVPKNIKEYNDEFVRQILFFGEILGDDISRERAQKYCDYFSAIMEKVRQRTEAIPAAERPRVYYGKVTDLCATQGNNTIMKWYTELAGGHYLSGDLPQYYATVSLEKILSWNPDYILLGSFGAFEKSAKKMPTQTTKAYKNGHVLRVPAGIFYWDMTSCETALLPLYLAKNFFPERFADWDLIAEMQKFYSAIYGVSLTVDEAQRILRGEGPK